MQFLKNLIFSGGSLPHGYWCLRTPGLVGLDVASDSLIVLSYLPFQERAAQSLSQLILFDLTLPKVDGLSVLKEDRRPRSIVEIVLTSSREDRDLIAGYHLGANKHIQKTVDFDRFRETAYSLGLSGLLGNQAPPQQAVNSSTEKSG